MDEGLRREVTEDLWKSGFGSELKAAQAFDGRESWSIATGTAFFDPVLNLSRELDLTAYKHRFLQATDGDFLLNVSVSLIAEIKKSETPWVVLRSRQWKSPEELFSMNAIIRCTSGPSESDVRAQFRAACIISANKWFGHGVYEALQKKKRKEEREHGRWFAAAAKTCRASTVSRNEPLLKFQEDTWVVDYIQPVVVLDGHLLAANLENNTQEIVVEEVPFASVRFEEHGPAHRGVFVVDLVGLTSLSSYIDRIEQGSNQCFARLREYRVGVAL